MKILDYLAPKTPFQKTLLNVFNIIFVMFFFLVSLKMMEGSVKLFGKDFALLLINSTSNPFIGLFIGLLATAIIQSSSSTTSMIVVLVATGDLTLANAIPMIMGANIGTSVTSTIVSMGHIGKRKEFRKAISAATIHDFFNIMIVIILLPIEIGFGFLSYISKEAADLLTGAESSGPEMFSFLDITVKPVSQFFIHLTNNNPYISIFFAIALLLVSIHFLTSVLKSLLIGKAKEKMDTVLFQKPFKSMLWGSLLTAGVQSSSVTTSLVVPLVATNKVSLRKAFPFLIGANIGTTITALIAALSSNNKEAALSIAFAHVFFNVLGAAIIFPIKPLRNIPIALSRMLGKATLKNRMIGFGYVAVTFFLIPFILILFTGSEKEVKEYNFLVEDYTNNKKTYNLILEHNNGDEKEWMYYSNLSAKPRTLPDIEERKIRISQKNNIVFYDKEFMILGKRGFCWDSEDLNGKFQICIDKILSDYVIPNYRSEKCYVYKKSYYLDGVLSKAHIKIYLDSNNLLKIKKEYFNSEGELIKKEEIIK